MTSYRSSIETIGLNCLVFQKMRFCVRILATDDGQKNRWTTLMRKGAFAIESGALIKDCVQGIVLLKLNADGHKASRGLSATADHL